MSGWFVTEPEEWAVDAPFGGLDPRDCMDEGEIHDMDDDFGIVPFHRIHVDEWAEETEEEDE